MCSSNLETIRKRLKWRATHRGIKEMDILLGGFAETHLTTMSESQLAEFAVILEIPDQDLLAWATRQEPIAIAYQSALLDAVLAFRPESLQ